MTDYMTMEIPGGENLEAFRDTVLVLVQPHAAERVVVDHDEGCPHVGYTGCTCETVRINLPVFPIRIGRRRDG